MTTPSLYSVLVQLVASHNVELPSSHAQNAHAALLNWLTQADPELATLLHSDIVRKPFTVSGLLNMSSAHDKLLRLRAGDCVELRFTFVHQHLFQTFTQPFWRTESPKLRLGPATFTIARVVVTPGSHAWAGAITADALVSSARGHISPKLALEFCSPTSFSDNDAKMIEMRPDYVFGSLVLAWSSLGLDMALNLSEIQIWRERFRQYIFGSTGIQGVDKTKRSNPSKSSQIR